MWNTSANLSYTIPFGKRPAAAPPSGGGGGGITIIGAGDMMIMRAAAPGGSGAARYRINLNVGVQNLTNRVNHTGWNGNMASPFFGQSTVGRISAKDRSGDVVLLLTKENDTPTPNLKPQTPNSKRCSLPWRL